MLLELRQPTLRRNLFALRLRKGGDPHFTLVDSPMDRVELLFRVFGFVLEDIHRLNQLDFRYCCLSLEAGFAFLVHAF